MPSAGASKGHKARLSSSPLAKPETIAHQLAAEIQDYLHFPDPGPLYVTLGAIAANMMCGRPVWLMLVGASSSGKTEVLMGMNGIPGMHMAEDLSGPGALLSGVAKRDVEKGATGGLLRKVGAHGGIIMEDFTSSVMKLPRETRDQILTAFRLAYKGRWSRDIGTGGGKTLVWEGKLAALAGGTPAIDRLTAEVSELGERWVYYRFPKTDGWGESRTSLQNQNPREGARKVQEAIKAFFDVLDLRWPCQIEGDYACKTKHEHFEEREKRKFTVGEYTRLIGMASLAAKMRSSIYRHPYSREIEDVPSPEAPPRLANTLGQLYLGLELIGLDEAERWRLIGKVAFDSVPEVRARVVRACWHAALEGKGSTGRTGSVVGIAELKAALDCSEATVKRVIEDLAAHRIVKRGGKNVVLTESAMEELKKNFSLGLKLR